jgi:hypothetical protein
LWFWCISSVCCYAYENQINIFSDFFAALGGQDVGFIPHLIWKSVCLWIVSRRWLNISVARFWHACYFH